ncbi:MAG: methyl-accepting chemotaxis protein [Desulfobacterales bacterium]|nr:methyl-accepting chemotaxis protein [Desulfobacterales bacterium]
MLRWFSKRIMAKLITQFLIVGLIPLILLGGMTYIYSRSAMESEAFNHLSAVNKIRKEQVLEFLKSRMKNLILLSRSQHIRNMLNTGTYREMNPLFDYYMKGFGYSNIFLLSKTGELMHQAQAPAEKDAAAETAPMTRLAAISKDIGKTEAPLLTDITNYQSGASPGLFMAAPIYADTGELEAILVFLIDAGRINAIASDKTGMGKTGETYLVGQDQLMRSQSRFLQDKSVLSEKIQTTAVKLALDKKAGTRQIRDYRNVEVLAAYDSLDLPKRMGTDFNWAIISQMDAAEAFSLLHKLGLNIFWTGLILLVLICGAGYVQSKMIARPINALSYRVMMMDEGDFTLTVSEQHKNRADEIGMLMKAFASGTQRFRKQIKQLGQSSRHLLSSISQISTTASQLASSASETSSSISEVTTTVEEVSQTSQLATEKAEYVSKSAENTARISLAGKQATENTTAGINRIKEEMNYIAESTVKLSEQTKSIEEIINTVTDIADQSNILSVNAAIEAAKAGEQGKGFAVVAQEVKTLADQSKEATSQVRSILGDIQKATSAAVMATERGTKTVEEAIELAEQAGNAIDRLERQVNESSDAAAQITASNQQQRSGIDQLSQAMESINDATQQNLDGVKQLEDAIKGLEELAQTMRDITSNYKV